MIYVGLTVKHVVDDTLGHYPQAENIPLIKHAGIHGFIALFGFFAQTWVVVHREMDVQRFLFLGLKYPLFAEPMLRVLGVAVEPELSPINAASCKGLLNERPRHERNLVEHDARECNALYQHIARFVAPTE